MIRRMVFSALASLLSIPFLLLHTPGHAAADYLFDFSGKYTYTIDPSAGVVHVTAEFDVAHNDESLWREARGIAYINAPVPFNAINPFTKQFGPTPQSMPLATHGRTVSAIRPQPIENSFDYVNWELGLRGQINYLYRAKVFLYYDIPGLPARSGGSTRANAAYFGFTAYAIGDPGKASIKVVVPSSYVIDTLGSEWSKSDADGTTVYSLDAIEEPDTASWYVAAHDDSKLAIADTSSGGADFTLKSWPNDSEWAGFVTSAITDGVPVLEQLIGQPWPITDTIDVTESYTPYVYGYAGWFSATEHRIEIGERLDHEVILHELAHAWFNTNWFQERWLDEGFAQLYANLATTQLGHTPTTPQPATITTDDPGYLPLNTWSNPDLTTSNHDRETFGYNASWSVVQQITDDIGIDAMTSILDHINNHTPTYPGNNPNETTSTTTNWQRFLDLTENIGHSTIAAGLFEDYVVDPGGARLLEKRAHARDAYEALVADSGDWAPPKLIRDEMAAWNFDDAERDITTAQSLIDLHHQLDTIADTAHLTYSPDLQTTYQDAATTTDLDQATNLLQNTLDTAHTLLDATHANNNSHGILGTIGLIGNDTDHTLTDARNALQRGDLTAARRGAQRISSATDGATKDGLTRLAIVLGIGTLAAAAVRWQRRKHTNTTPPGATAAGE